MWISNSLSWYQSFCYSPLEGEGLNIANFMVANSDTDGVFDREFFRGAPDSQSGPHTILYWNEEFRATLWGHMTLLNLRYLVEPIFTGFKDTTHPWDVPTNADIADQTISRAATSTTRIQPTILKIPFSLPTRPRLFLWM